MDNDKWVSVKEQLPRDDDDILVACSWFDVALTAWHESGRFYFMDGELAENVTHWMYAPKTPNSISRPPELSKVTP